MTEGKRVAVTATEEVRRGMALLRQLPAFAEAEPEALIRLLLLLGLDRAEERGGGAPCGPWA